MKLWLVRHARPLIDSGVCYGALDMAADAEATLAAARNVAAALPDRVVLLASPLQRCQQLASALCGLRPDLRLQTEPDLAEMNFGTWEGQRWNAIPKDAFEAWRADFGAHLFGGQESVHMLMQRVGRVWDQTRQQGQDAVWISHAGVIRVAALLAQGVRHIDSAAQWPRQAPEFGQWLEVTI